MQTTDFLTRRDLCALLHCGKTASYALTARPEFPRPFDLNGRNLCVWSRAEVLAWIASQPRRTVGTEPAHLVASRKFRDGKLVAPRNRRAAEA